MKYLILAALMMSLGLVSCGKENPLSGKDQGVQEATPPANSEKPQGDDEKALRIDTDDFYSFTEEQDNQYQIKGIVLIAKADFELSIENLADFPDAKFDPATGVFEWMPPNGFITDFNTKRMNLNILISTKNVTPIRIKHKTVPVFVTPSAKIPTVMSVKFDQGRTSMREGEVLKFDVQVKDITGVDVEGSRPALNFLPGNDGSVEAASLVTEQDLGYNVSNPSVDANDKSLWTFHMQIDLRKREVTASKVNVRFNIVAVSRFKVVSQSLNASLDILTGLQAPTLSWAEAQQMKAGQKNNFTFMVLDPRGEGEVQFSMLTDCSKISPTLTCGACTSIKDPTLGKILSCPVSWDIPADYLTSGGASTVTLEMQINSKSKISGDNYATPVQTLTRTIRVLPADPVPAPGPAAVGGN